MPQLVIWVMHSAGSAAAGRGPDSGSAACASRAVTRRREVSGRERLVDASAGRTAGGGADLEEGRRRGAAAATGGLGVAGFGVEESGASADAGLGQGQLDSAGGVVVSG